MGKGRGLSPLNRKLLRDLRIHWPQVAAIVAVVTLGVIMFAGPLLAQHDLRRTVEGIYARTDYEDFSADVGSAPVDSVDEVARLANVKDVEGRITGDLQAEVGGSRITVRVISVPDDRKPAVNRLILESGRYLEPGRDGGCLAERHLASEFSLEPGDTVYLLRNGERVRLRVEGSVISPEYIRLVRGRADYVTDPSTFGVIFMPYSAAASVLGSEGEVNNFVATVLEERELSRTMDRVGSVLEPYGLVGLTAGSDEPGASALSFEIDTIGRLAMFFAVLLLVVAALAVYITMTQIVFSQQRQIGVTMALGYERRKITNHYLGYGMILGVTGGMLGIVFGYYLSRLFVHIYAGIFELPAAVSTIQVFTVLTGVVVAVVFSVAGAIVPAKHSVGMKPAEAMRMEAGLALGAPRRTPHGKPRAGRLPLWLRVSLRNLLRNRRRTVLTCLGVVATICLMVTASGGRDSLDYAVDKYLNGVLRWDVAIVWSGPQGGEVLERVRGIEGVEAAEPVIDAPARLVFGGYSLDVQVQAYPRDTELHGDYPEGGSVSRPGPGQVVLNRSVKKRVPVRVGDDVTLSTTIGSLPFEVAGFVSEPFGGVCYVNLEYIQGLLSGLTGLPGQFNAVALKAGPDSEEGVVSALRGLPGVSQVITKERILSVFEELVRSIKTLFLIFYIMAFTMGFAVLFSMITVNLFERRREIATVRTLGAGRARIFAFVTVETLAVVTAGVIPGILLGRFLEWFVIERLVGSVRLSPDVVLSGATVAVIVAASVVVMVLSELPSIRKLWRLDLASVTRERAD